MAPGTQRNSYPPPLDPPDRQAGALLEVLKWSTVVVFAIICAVFVTVIGVVGILIARAMIGLVR